MSADYSEFQIVGLATDTDELYGFHLIHKKCDAPSMLRNWTNWSVLDVPVWEQEGQDMAKLIEAMNDHWRKHHEAPAP